MSKTTDALDWAYENGYRAAIAQLEPVAAPQPASHDAFAESYPDEVQFHYDGGFNEALDFARDEILENLDTLVAIYQRAAADDGLDVQTELMTAIDRRVSELKR